MSRKILHFGPENRVFDSKNAGLSPLKFLGEAYVWTL